MYMRDHNLKVQLVLLRDEVATRGREDLDLERGVLLRCVATTCLHPITKTTLVKGVGWGGPRSSDLDSRDLSLRDGKMRR